MNNHFYSNKEFTDLKKQLNEEMLRRGGFKWFNPLSTPKIGEDKSSPLSTPSSDPMRILVDDRTYTINNTSEGSIEPTRNIHYPDIGENPAGKNPTFSGSEPNTSAAHLSADEMRNFIVGLSKINDINLFYGRDEIVGTAYRDPKGIKDLADKATFDKINRRFKFTYSFDIETGDLYITFEGEEPNVYIDGDYLYFEYIDENGYNVLTRIHFEVIDNVLYMDNAEELYFFKKDPNGGQMNDKNPNYPVRDYEVTFPLVNGEYVLPSGEYDGDELKDYEGLGPLNFFDDYGAQPGDGNYHPYNKAVTPITRRDILEQDDHRNIKRIQVLQGGRKSSEFGPNPRNPAQGNEYKPYPAYKGMPSTCANACTGLCSLTCDDICSESCKMTCTMRCGNQCTSSCGNQCTGCSSQCYNTCKTKCENNEGYACVNAGAKTMEIVTENGRPTIHTTTYSCTGCSYSCQFYPNKKTTCWDAGCMGKCFTSCNSGCAESCKGSCMDAGSENSSDYKTGKGVGCSSFCTLNCIGTCHGVCEGQCTTTCFSTCKQQCFDNCEFSCSTNCGSGCAYSCTDGCENGCSTECSGSCKDEADSTACTGCGMNCIAICQYDCTSSCFNRGCYSMCGVNTDGACSANCRMNCSSTSCTALCSDACSSQCTTCVNSCGFECGNSCTVQCGYECDSTCRYKCNQECENTCSLNCVKSCSEECAGCSNLCYSCVGMCIGICSIKCENGCSSCTNNCGYWCDTTCNQECFANCSTLCMDTCHSTCETYSDANSTNTEGPDRLPTSIGYPIPNPILRTDEQKFFQLINREAVVIIDPFNFRIEGNDLFITLDDGSIVHLIINDNGYLELTDVESEEDRLLTTYNFQILDDGTLRLERH